MLSGVLGSTSAAWAQWRTDFSSCAIGFSGPIFSATIPLVTLTIPRSSGVGFVGPWSTKDFYWIHLCAKPVANVLNIDINERLYVLGNKPSSTISSGHTINDGEKSYVVFTSSILQQYGLGDILRWRAKNNQGSAVGPWHTPSETWLQESVSDIDMAGQPLFYKGYLIFNNCIDNIGHHITSGLGTYSEFSQAVNTYGHYSCLYVLYRADVEVRYVKVQNSSFEFDSGTANEIIELLTLYRPQGVNNELKNVFSQAITIHYPPWGTCTTGTVLVPLGTHSPNDLPSVGSPSTQPARAFDIELSNCPRVNIGYSFVAPNGIGYDSATGVVDLDSTAGNAEGVGIQIPDTPPQ